MHRVNSLMLSISKRDLKRYVIKQLNNFFPDNHKVVRSKKIDWAFDDALSRIEFCFKHISDNIVHVYHISINGVSYPFFQHTNSDQYCQFLYFLSN